MEKQEENLNFINLRNSWQKMVAPYAHADLRHSLGQIATSLFPYLALWALMIFSLHVSIWLSLVFAILAAAFLIRIFIIFHDCGHGSFFKSRTANQWVGFLVGVLVFTPSENWWHDHAVHHATAGDLDRRGVGDVNTMTVEEYRQSSRWHRLTYRVFRNPLAMFIVGPIVVFLILNRFPTRGAGRKEKLSVVFADLVIAVIFVLMSMAIGWKAYLLLQVFVMWLAGAAGIWMFYVQHQFENVYWVHSAQWDYLDSALKGASCYQLPKLFQWFTGNIGFHHIHHLSPRIPNYFLELCYKENPLLRANTTLNLISGLKSLSLRLWDEQAQRMVSFRSVRTFQG
jgi:acyl-lipid omega-6 desaturase (Delta-12 desaturase)